jgi:hypothetical protein
MFDAITYRIGVVRHHAAGEQVESRAQLLLTVCSIGPFLSSIAHCYGASFVGQQVRGRSVVQGTDFAYLEIACAVGHSSHGFLQRSVVEVVPHQATRADNRSGLILQTRRKNFHLAPEQRHQVGFHVLDRWLKDEISGQ